MLGQLRQCADALRQEVIGMPNPDELAAIEGRIGSDPTFADRMDFDAIATLEAEGFPDTARELRRVSEPLERLFRRAEDDERWASEFQAAYERDPAGALVSAGVDRGVANALVEAGTPEVEGFTYAFPLTGGDVLLRQPVSLTSKAGQSFVIYKYLYTG
jgi:hypothetical protein